MQRSNTFAACLWKSFFVWGNISSLYGSGWSVKVSRGQNTSSEGARSESLVENLRNRKSAFVEYCGQNFYLSCLERLGDLTGEFSTRGIGFENHDQAVRQPPQGDGVAILAERRCIDQDVVELLTQFRPALFQPFRVSQAWKIRRQRSAGKEPEVTSADPFGEIRYWGIFQQSIRKSSMIRHTEDLSKRRRAQVGLNNAHRSGSIFGQ